MRGRVTNEMVMTVRGKDVQHQRLRKRFETGGALTGDAEILQTLVHETLDVSRDRARAVVQNGLSRYGMSAGLLIVDEGKTHESGLVVEDSSHPHLRFDVVQSACNTTKSHGTAKTYPLLFAPRENVLPLLPRLPPTLARREVLEVNLLEDADELRVRSTGCLHLRIAVRVDDLQRGVEESAPERESPGCEKPVGPDLAGSRGKGKA